MLAYFTLVFLRRLWHVLYLCLLLLVLVQAIIYSKTYFPEYRVTLGRLTIVSYLYILKFYVQHTYKNNIYKYFYLQKTQKFMQFTPKQSISKNKIINLGT